jgi:hypothetical protein
MRSILYLTAIVSALVLAAVPATAATKVFLIGGQSNAAGVGGLIEVSGVPGVLRPDPLPAPYNVPQPAVRFWNYLGTNANGDGGTGYGNGWVDLRGGFGIPGPISCFGPEVSFGHRLHELLPDDNIYLVKEGVDGASLVGPWNPNGSGAGYNTFKARVDGAIKNLTDADLSPTIAGMIWMQGEGDAQNITNAANYATNLTNFIGKVRSDFKTPDMPFVVGRILTYYDTTPAGGNALVRTAEETVPGLVGHASWINTDDLQKAYAGHFGTQGQIDLGIRFANEFSQIPEPSTLVLTGTALLALAGYRWRKETRVGGAKD